MSDALRAYLLGRIPWEIMSCLVAPPIEWGNDTPQRRKGPLDELARFEELVIMLGMGHAKPWADRIKSHIKDVHDKLNSPAFDLQVKLQLSFDEFSTAVSPLHQYNLILRSVKRSCGIVAKGSSPKQDSIRDVMTSYLGDLPGQNRAPADKGIRFPQPPPVPNYPNVDLARATLNLVFLRWMGFDELISTLTKFTCKLPAQLPAAAKLGSLIGQCVFRCELRAYRQFGRHGTPRGWWELRSVAHSAVKVEVLTPRHIHDQWRVREINDRGSWLRHLCDALGEYDQKIMNSLSAGDLSGIVFRENDVCEFRGGDICSRESFRRWCKATGEHPVQARDRKHKYFGADQLKRIVHEACDPEKRLKPLEAFLHITKHQYKLSELLAVKR